MKDSQNAKKIVNKILTQEPSDTAASQLLAIISKVTAP